jgi:hypothetical protein
VDNSAAHIPKAALHTLAVIEQSQHCVRCGPRPQMGRAKLVKCDTVVNLTCRRQRPSTLGRSAKTVSFS